MRTLIPTSDDELNEEFFAACFENWSNLPDDIAKPSDAVCDAYTRSPTPWCRRGESAGTVRVRRAALRRARRQILCSGRPSR